MELLTTQAKKQGGTEIPQPRDPLVAGEFSNSNSNNNNGNGNGNGQVGSTVNDEWLIAKPNHEKQVEQGIPKRPNSDQSQNPLAMLADNTEEGEDKNTLKIGQQVETATTKINGGDLDDAENNQAQPKGQLQFQQPIGQDVANAPPFFFQVDDPNQQQPHSLT